MISYDDCMRVCVSEQSELSALQLMRLVTVRTHTIANVVVMHEEAVETLRRSCAVRERIRNIAPSPVVVAADDSAVVADDDSAVVAADDSAVVAVVADDSAVVAADDSAAIVADDSADVVAVVADAIGDDSAAVVVAGVDDGGDQLNNDRRSTI